jgi:hypothetical protein
MGMAGQTGLAYENAPAMATHFVSVNFRLSSFSADVVVRRGRPSLLDRPIGPACAVLFEIDIDRILFAATLDQPFLLPLSGAGRA